ncbi:MAG: 2-hydroxychromene-2-carboxylate isomerase [Pseudomonadota bacterium]
MTQTVDFIFDFASPNAYLAHRALTMIADRTGAKINLIPCLLGGIFKSTGNQAPMIAFSGVKGKLDYEMLEMRRFIEEHDLSGFKMNPHFPVNSLTIIRGLIAAQQSGVEEPYVEAVLKAMWEDGENMADEAVIRSVLSDAGLDADGILEATKSAEVKTVLIGNTNDAVARGVFGVPTFFVGDEMFFGKDRLHQVEKALG